MKKPTPFVPIGPLEEALVFAKRGKITLQQFLAVLVKSDIVVPSLTEVRPDGSGLRPLLFRKEEADMVALFTSLERAREVAEKAPYALQINARECMARLPKEVGVVVNPGYTEGFDIDPNGIGNILRDYRASSRK